MTELEIKVDGKKVAVRRGDYEVEGEVGSTTLTVYDITQTRTSPSSLVAMYKMVGDGFSYIIGDSASVVCAFESNYTRAIDLLGICRDELRAIS